MCWILAEDCDKKHLIKRKFLSFKYHKAEKFHKIMRVIKDPIATLVIIKPRRRVWGYHLPDGEYKGYQGGWINNETFRELKNQPQK